MKLLKYILLLFFLFVIGLFVFIATKKSDYHIKVSRTIKTPQSVVYNYVNELQNWEEFASWNEANNLKFQPSKITTGVGAGITWTGNSTGTVTTLSVKNQDSISQKLVLDDTESNITWKFKTNKKGTEITILSQGKMTLMEKINSFFNANSSNSLSDVFYKTLVNLDKNLDYELNTFTIKNNGIVAKPKTFFICKTINSEENKVNKNTTILIREMIAFFDKNNIKKVGKPIAIYNSKVNNVINFSVCLALKDSVYISPNSDVFSGKIETTTAIKRTLTGDYSHLKTVKDSIYSYINKNNLKINPSVKPFDVFVKTKADTKKPSQWVTEIYIPIVSRVTSNSTVVANKPTIVVQKPLPTTPAENY